MLPDLLETNLNVVFCGSAAGTKSAERGHYYAGPGNQFYAILHKTGLTPSLLKPDQYPSLLQHRIGLTDLNQTESGMDKHLSKGGFDIGAFRSKIESFQPKFIAFNGKKAAQEYFASTGFDYGAHPATLGRTRIFVMPSTSGAARGFWDEQIWHALASEITLS